MVRREERWVSGPKLMRVIKSAQRDARRDELAPPEAEDLVIKRVSKYLKQQPDQPPLVGVSEAADILKVPKPRIMRFRAQGRLPKEVVVEGPSAAVYVKPEIEAFAKEIQEGRDLRRVTTEARNVGGVAA